MQNINRNPACNTRPEIPERHSDSDIVENGASEELRPPASGNPRAQDLDPYQIRVLQVAAYPKMRRLLLEPGLQSSLAGHSLSSAESPYVYGQLSKHNFSTISSTSLSHWRSFNEKPMWHCMQCVAELRVRMDEILGELVLFFNHRVSVFREAFNIDHFVSSLLPAKA